MFRWVGSYFAPTRFPPPPIQDESHLMKAVILREHGGPEVMEYIDFPTPKPPQGSKDIVVDIVAAGINPVDCKLRQGPAANFLYPKPKIVGGDMAGIVSFAPEGSAFKKGQRVFAMLPLLCSTFGSYAEKCCVAEDILCLAPSNYSLVDLATIPLVATTVIQAMRPVKEAFPGDILKSKKIFIPNGSGGVGTFAIQYCANELGMQVTTSCSSKNMALCKSLGAQEVIDYKTTDFAEVIRDYDVVLDSMGFKNEETILYGNKHILKPSTKENPTFYLRIASSPHGKSQKEESDFPPDPLGWTIPESRIDRVIGSFTKQYLANHFNILPNGIRYYFILVVSEKPALEEVRQAIEKGTIKPVIQERIPLSEAVRAHEIQEDGHVTGKLVLVVNSELEGRETAQGKET